MIRRNLMIHEDYGYDIFCPAMLDDDVTADAIYSVGLDDVEFVGYEFGLPINKGHVPLPIVRPESLPKKDRDRISRFDTIDIKINGTSPDDTNPVDIEKGNTVELAERDIRRTHHYENIITRLGQLRKPGRIPTDVGR